MKSNYKRLGKYITEVNKRNTDKKVSRLLGVSIKKILIPSIANTIGTDMSKYKILEKNQFVYGPITSRNGDKISIALLSDYENALVSQSYKVFKIIDTNELLPEYLMMWFTRPEFDRYARFMSHGSTREAFDWDEMCNVELPLPDIEKQKEIVKEYNVLKDRIKLNNNLINKLEETAQTIYREWFIDFEFPNEDGKPYKSNGGEMVFNEESGKEIPKGWNIDTIKNNVIIIDNRGKTPENFNIKTNFPLIEIGSLRSFGRAINFKKCNKYVSEKTYKHWFRSGHPKENDVLISTVGSLAEMKLFLGNKGCIAQNIVAFRANKNIQPMYLYQLLVNIKKELLSYEIGSVQASIKVSQIIEHKVLIPSNNTMLNYEKVIKSMSYLIGIKQSSIEETEVLKKILLQNISLLK